MCTACWPTYSCAVKTVSMWHCSRWPKSAEAAANTTELAARLAAFNAGRGSSERIERLLLLTEPPSADQHEVSDKGTINQRVALARRSTDVDRAVRADAGAGRDPACPHFPLISNPQ